MDAWSLRSALYIIVRLEKIADRQKRIARCMEQLKLSKNYALELAKVYSDIKDSYTDVLGQTPQSRLHKVVGSICM